MLALAFLFVCVAAPCFGYTPVQPSISLLIPTGIRFEYPGTLIEVLNVIFLTISLAVIRKIKVLKISLCNYALLHNVRLLGMLSLIDHPKQEVLGSFKKVR